METPATEQTSLLHSINAEDPINASIDSDHAPRTSIGFFAVVFLTVNATLGAGLLNIPFAFAESGGILTASYVQSLHVILVIVSLMILSCCSQVSKCDSLQGIVLYFCGPTWSHLCSLSIFLYSYGACVTYVIIIGDQFDKFFGTFYPNIYNQHWYISGDFLILSISILTILPLCFSKDISFLKFASFFGFCCTLYLTILIFVEYIKVSHNSAKISVKSQQNKWTDALNVVPVLTFSYQCQLSWVPTYAQIKNRGNYWKIFGMIIVSMLVCFVSYTWTAVFGILAFGSDHIEKDIMQNYDPKDPFVSFAMILLIVKTIVVYPVLLFCGRIVIEDFFRSWNNHKPIVLRVTIATVWVLSSCILAILVPNIAVAINYLGSLANLFVFILPGLSLYCALFDTEQLQSIQNEFKLLRRKVPFYSFQYFSSLMGVSQQSYRSANR